MRLYPLCVSALLLSCLSARANISLPRILSSDMVIQRDAEIPVWGWADPGEKVTATIGADSVTTVTGKDGRWILNLPEKHAGESFDISIQGNNSIVLNNVLAGDVWVCSGQSNMQTTISRIAERYPKEIATCTNPNLRMFTAPTAYNFHAPQDDLPSGEWLEFTPQNVPPMSGVAFFFARKLYAETGVPIGIINVSLGGSPIAAWLGEDALAKFPDLLKEALRWRDDKLIEETEAYNHTIENAWYGTLDRTDPGLKPGKEWFLDDVNTSNWTTAVSIPGDMASQGIDSMGTIWLRKEIDLPADLAGQPALLRLGTIYHADTAYINGQKVGQTYYEYPPRRYSVSSGILKAGRNILTIRLTCPGGRGAAFTLDKPYQLEVGGKIFDLKGQWLCQRGSVMPPKGPGTGISMKPMGLHNGMLGPISRLHVKGVVWYQGESDTWQPQRYGKLLQALVADWRSMWGNVPVILQQLPNFMEPTTGPAESGWADMRETQRKALAIPNTAMAVAIDLGEWNDIHPLNKKDVGDRIGLAALKLAYGQDIVASGPLYRSVRIEGNKAILSFDSIGSGLVAKDGPELRQFTIAGADGIFHSAKAEIRDDTVVVWSDEVPAPVKVRYAWASNPQGANLYNKEGLPASPFEASLKP